MTLFSLLLVVVVTRHTKVGLDLDCTKAGLDSDYTRKSDWNSGYTRKSDLNSGCTRKSDWIQTAHESRIGIQAAHESRIGFRLHTKVGLEFRLHTKVGLDSDCTRKSDWNSGCTRKSDWNSDCKRKSDWIQSFRLHTKAGLEFGLHTKVGWESPTLFSRNDVSLANWSPPQTDPPLSDAIRVKSDRSYVFQSDFRAWYFGVFGTLSATGNWLNFVSSLSRSVSGYKKNVPYIRMFFFVRTFGDTKCWDDDRTRSPSSEKFFSFSKKFCEVWNQFFLFYFSFWSFSYCKIVDSRQIRHKG